MKKYNSVFNLIIFFIIFSIYCQSCDLNRVEDSQYAIGVDLSFLKMREDQGVVFKDQGLEKPGLQIFKDHGYNWIRLRLFHTPDDLPNDLQYTMNLARAAKNIGFNLLLDFHYSDTWASPSKQFVPKLWENLSFQTLIDSVFQYSKRTIEIFRNAGIMPDMVQVGNEISNGMLWPYGKIPENWDGFYDLINAGVKGINEGRGNKNKPLIMIHVDKAGIKEFTEQFFKKFNTYKIDYDVIGLSYYPWNHGSFTDLRKNLTFMADTYHKPIYIVECAFSYEPGPFKRKNIVPPFPETPQGQKEFLEELNKIVQNIPNGMGRGIFWWEPVRRPNDLYPRGFFDREGNSLPVITVFDKYKKFKN